MKKRKPTSPFSRAHNQAEYQTLAASAAPRIGQKHGAKSPYHRYLAGQRSKFKGEGGYTAFFSASQRRVG